jgi:hypothetical protein
LETRRKKALQVGLVAARIILGADPKSAPLSFTPEIRMALTKAQTDVVAIKEKALVSHTDELPVGFRPDPFPPKTRRPAIERDPVAALGPGSSGPRTAEMVASVSEALRQQGHRRAAGCYDDLVRQILYEAMHPSRHTSSDIVSAFDEFLAMATDRPLDFGQQLAVDCCPEFLDRLLTDGIEVFSLLLNIIDQGFQQPGGNLDATFASPA